MKSIAAVAFLMAILLGGCSSGNSKAAELFETASFEEKQHNLEHASKLYREIVASYPGTPTARDAATRLEVLRPTKP